MLVHKKSFIKPHCVCMKRHKMGLAHNLFEGQFFLFNFLNVKVFWFDFGFFFLRIRVVLFLHYVGSAIFNGNQNY